MTEPLPVNWGATLKRVFRSKFSIIWRSAISLTFLAGSIIDFFCILERQFPFQPEFRLQCFHTNIVWKILLRVISIEQLFVSFTISM
jgi:hypothetical protein